jgi:hypothetical protein
MKALSPSNSFLEYQKVRIYNKSLTFAESRPYDLRVLKIQWGRENELPTLYPALLSPYPHPRETEMILFSTHVAHTCCINDSSVKAWLSFPLLSYLLKYCTSRGQDSSLCSSKAKQLCINYYWQNWQLLHLSASTTKTSPHKMDVPLF